MIHGLRHLRRQRVKTNNRTVEKCDSLCNVPYHVKFLSHFYCLSTSKRLEWYTPSFQFWGPVCTTLGLAVLPIFVQLLLNFQWPAKSLKTAIIDELDPCNRQNTALIWILHLLQNIESMFNAEADNIFGWKGISAVLSITEKNIYVTQMFYSIGVTFKNWHLKSVSTKNTWWENSNIWHFNWSSHHLSMTVWYGSAQNCNFPKLSFMRSQSKCPDISPEKWNKTTLICYTFDIMMAGQSVTHELIYIVYSKTGNFCAHWIPFKCFSRMLYALNHFLFPTSLESIAGRDIPTSSETSVPDEV